MFVSDVRWVVFEVIYSFDKVGVWGDGSFEELFEGGDVIGLFVG